MPNFIVNTEMSQYHFGDQQIRSQLPRPSMLKNYTNSNYFSQEVCQEQKLSKSYK